MPKFASKLSMLRRARSKDQCCREKVDMTENNGETGDLSQENRKRHIVLMEMERDGSNVTKA